MRDTGLCNEAGAEHRLPSRRHDAIVFHANVQALRHIELTLTLGTGISIDGIDTLEGLNGLSGTYRLTIAAGGADISYDG
jgi:hypothetical protein